MHNTMINTIVGLVFVLAGLIFSFFHKKIGHNTAEFHYNLWHVHFSEKGCSIGFLLWGVMVLVFGLLLVLQIIKCN